MDQQQVQNWVEKNKMLTSFIFFLTEQGNESYKLIGS